MSRVGEHIASGYRVWSAESSYEIPGKDTDSLVGISITVQEASAAVVLHSSQQSMASFASYRIEPSCTCTHRLIVHGRDHSIYITTTPDNTCHSASPHILVHHLQLAILTGKDITDQLKPLGLISMHTCALPLRSCCDTKFRLA